MHNVITIRDAKGIRWEVSAPYVPLFLSDRAHDPQQLLKKREGEIIKRSPARVIFSCVLAEGGREIPVVIKIYRHPRIGDWLKANLCGSKGRREWVVTTAAAERGLPTVMPVAYGERRSVGLMRESFLLTVRLYDCVTLEEALFSPDGTLKAAPRPRRRLILLLAALLRRMHDSGIYHRDLHPGNFLVQTTSSGEQRMYLLDLHRASVRPSLGIRQRIRSLAQFNMFARISLSRSERLLFFDAYFGEDRPWRDDKRPLLDAIESLARTMSWRLWKRREQRCLSGNKYFMCLSFARMKGFARREEWKSEMAELLLGGDMVTIGARRVKESRSKALWEKEMVIRGVPRTLLIKQYKRKRGWKSIAYLTRPSQAIRSWRGSHALQIRNVGTVKAIAAIEERSPFHFLGNAYLISEKIPNVVNLAAVVSTLVDHTPAADAEKDALLRGLALFLRRIHALGIVHGDMKATNILVGARKNGGHAFYLTDLDFVRTRLRLSRRQVIRNLMQLNKSLTDLSRVSLRDRLRFLRAYCGAQTRDEIRGLRQTVARRTARSLKKSGRQFYHSQ